jgi:hypothetical protein
MLENEYPGSIGKILENLLAKVEEMPIELVAPGLSSIVDDKQIISNYGGVSGNSLTSAQDIKMIQNETIDSVKECKFLC